MDIGNILGAVSQGIGVANSILPLVGATVDSSEKMFGPGKGAVKKEAALAAVSGVVGVAQKAGVTGDVNTALLMEGISDMIEGAVKINNATGVFKKA